jgi:Tat protein translocase TatB subunit
VGSIGGAELVLILLLALLLFGPRKLPQIGRTLGRALTDLRRATTDFKTNLEREVNLEQVTDLHGQYKSAKTEVSEAVKEFRNLGIPRNLGLDEDHASKPAAKPRISEPPAAANEPAGKVAESPATETTRSPSRPAPSEPPPPDVTPTEPADDDGPARND